MVGAGLSAPTQSSAGIAANAAAPAASYVIGQEFKRRNAEGSLGHLLAHATLGGLTAAAGGNDPLSGALSSGGAEAAAGYISGLFGQTDGSRLSTEQKETVRAIAGLFGTAAGAALGNTSADVAQGSLNAKNAVENNWLSSRQLIEAEKAYLACGNDEACKQRVIDAARYLSYTQDTSLTSAKLQCLTINSCDNINTLNKQWLDSINIRNVVAELRIHYPNASYQQLLSAAQKYAAEADSSFKQGTTRFIVGALTDLPALGLAKQPVSVGTQSIINLLKRRVVSKAPSVNPIIMLQESRRTSPASPFAAGQGRSGHAAPATPTQPNRQAQTGVPQGTPKPTAGSGSGAATGRNTATRAKNSIFDSYPQATTLNLGHKTLLERAQFLSQHIPGLPVAQAKVFLEMGARRNTSIVIGGSRVRGNAIPNSDIDIGFGHLNPNQAGKALRQIKRDSAKIPDALKVEDTVIAPGNETKNIPRISSPEEFFQRPGNRAGRDGRAGQPFHPSGSVTIHPNGIIQINPPRK